MKKFTKLFDLPLVQRFLDNRWAIGVACAVMVAAGVVAAMLTSGGPEPASDAKPSLRDSAAQAAQPEEPPNQRQSETQRRPQESAHHRERPPTPAGEAHAPRPPSARGHELGSSFDNGTHFVGGAVAPGTYTTMGSNGDPAGCEWARLADNGGELVPIVSGSTHGQAHITVRDGEYVRSTGCQTWTRSHSAKGYGGK